MRLSPSIDLLIQLAAQEAIASEFEKIEPEHLLESVLKFAELPVQELKKITPSPEILKELTAEIGAIKTELDRAPIDTTLARHRLREEIGKGKSPYKGGRVHRSDSTRAIFDTAAALASKAGIETLSARHLLDAILAAPTTSISKVLGAAGATLLRNRAETPFLGKYGKDMRPFVGAAVHVTSLKAESGALIQALSLKNRPCVFIVSDNDELVKSIVIRTVASGALETFKGKWIVDLTALKSIDKDRSTIFENLSTIFDEATNLPGVILFLPPIDLCHNKQKDWINQLKASLTKRSTQCICRLGETAYQEYVKKYTHWKKLANVMWVHERTGAGIPSKL